MRIQGFIHMSGGGPWDFWLPSKDGPENGWLEDDRFLFGNGIGFQVQTVSFRKRTSPASV